MRHESQARAAGQTLVERLLSDSQYRLQVRLSAAWPAIVRYAWARGEGCPVLASLLTQPNDAADAKDYLLGLINQQVVCFQGRGCF